MYQPDLGRWFNVDPLAELYLSATPYNYVLNTPVNAIDPDGMSCVGCKDGENVSGDPRRGLTSNGGGGGGKTVNGGTMVKDTDGQMVEQLPTALITPKGSGVPDADVHEWSYTGSYADYQNEYPTYGGMSHAEALDYWDTYHKEGFYNQWDAEVRAERGRIAVQKMAFFIQGFQYASFSLGALSNGGNLSTPRQFSLSPRGANIAPTHTLNPTHYITRSKSSMLNLVDDIRQNGISQPVRFVNLNGNKMIVDGHHRYFTALKLGMRNVPVQQVSLPYRGYRSASDLMLEGRMPGYWKHIKF